MKMNKNSKLFMLGIFFLIVIAFSQLARAEIDLMGLTLDVREAGLDISSGNISIEIYDAASAGNLIYNSTNAFNNNITNGKVDVMLGSDSSGVELNLTFGATYYMDLVINGNDVDFNSLERQEFQSQIGNITQARLNLTDTLYTNALIPYANLTFDLGSAENYYRNAFIQTLTLANTLDSGNISDVYLFNTGDTASGDYTFDSPTFRIDSGNNFIGIGTTTPANALNVVGDGNFSGALYVGGVQITADSNVSGGGTANYIVKFLAGTTIGNSLIYDDGTLIGIDTTSPQGKLHIDNSTTLNVPWINVTDGGNGVKFVLDNAGRVGIGRYPSEMFEVLGAGLLTGNLTVQGITDVGNLITGFINTTHLLDRTLLADDLADSSINSTLIVDRTLLSDDLADSSINSTIILDNDITTEDILAATINGSDIDLNSEFIIANLSVTDNITAQFNFTVADSLLIDYIYANALASTIINNLSVTNDIFSSFNITAADSINSDYLFPKSASFTRIDNVTIAQDLRVLGSSYLSSFTIGNDLLVGQSNISSTFVGLGTLSPEYLLHLNISNNDNESVSPLLLLEKTNLSEGAGDGYGSSILFRLQDDFGEVENISQIAGILEDVSNGTERGALVFYTGYGDVNGIVSNLSSAEAARISANGTLTLQNDLRVLGNSYLGSLTFTDNGTFPDSILTDFIYPESSGNIALMGGNVGIGTTAPDTTLDIADGAHLNSSMISLGSVNARDIVGFGSDGRIIGVDSPSGQGVLQSLHSTANQVANLVLGFNNTHYTRIQYDGPSGSNPGEFSIGTLSNNINYGPFKIEGDGDFVFNTSDLFIDVSAGNVGIGTTTPGAGVIGKTLEVSNAADGEDVVLKLVKTTGSNQARTVYETPGVNWSVGSRAGAKFHITNSSAFDGSTDLFTIDTSGNVGIGTTSPCTSCKLHISGGRLHIKEASGNAMIQLADNDVATNWTVYMSGADLRLYDGVGAADRVTFQQGGNVGIGTTSPGTVLDVTKAGAAGTPLVIINNTLGTGSADDGAILRLVSARGSGTVNADLFEVFGDSGSTSLFTINNGGNVGIGTTTPRSKLDVTNNDALFLSLNSSTGTNNVGIDFLNGSLMWEIYLNPTDAGKLYFDSVQQAGTRMVLDQTGNVGIGVTSPVEPFQVRGATVSSGDKESVIRIEDTTAQAAGVGGGILFGGKYTDAGDYTGLAGIQGIKENAVSGNYASALIFTTLPAGGGYTERMRIDSSGNVGIGTTTPSQLLEVNSALNGVPMINLTDGGKSGVVIRDGTSTDIYGLIQLFENTGGTETERVRLYSNGNNWISPNGGNVGIGTTTPTHTLNVVGDVNITGDLFVQGQNMTVPDYVFDYYFDKNGFEKENKGTRLENYTLMTISAMAQVIKANRSLGESPIQGNFGMDTGSNNLVQQQYYLLEKVEEQAIYIIQLQEQLDDQNKSFNARIQALEAQKQQNTQNNN